VDQRERDRKLGNTGIVVDPGGRRQFIGYNETPSVEQRLHDTLHDGLVALGALGRFLAERSDIGPNDFIRLREHVIPAVRSGVRKGCSGA
jgi:hypothetical protein